MARSNVTKVWTSAELVTTADLNQVAENANPQRDWTQANNWAAAITLSALATFAAAFSVSHTPRTSRVRINITFSAANATGLGPLYEFTIMHGAASPTTNVTGSATAGMVRADYLSTAERQAFHIEYILSGLTPGTIWYFGLGSRRNTAGAGITLDRYNIVIEDI